MSLELPTPDLGWSDEEIQRRFDALQAKLVPLWKAIETLDDEGEQTIVVVPSLTVDYAALQGSVSTHVPPGSACTERPDRMA